MDLKHMRYFVAAVEEGSLQRAAQRLHIAQPALSRRIRDLEADMECDLLVRAPRGVSPTRAGASLYRDALALLEDAEATRRRTSALGREEERVLRIGLMPTARKYRFVPDALQAFAHSADAVALSYERAASADLATRLRESAIDLALLYERRMTGPDIGERLVHRERYVLAVHPAHVLAKAGALSIADIAQHPLVWLSRRDDADHHDLLLQQCRLHGVDPLIAHTAQGHEAQIDLAVVTQGAFLTPASTMLSTPKDMLVFRALVPFSMEISLTLAWRRAVESEPDGSDLLAQFHHAIDAHQARLDADRESLAVDGERVFVPT